MGATAPLVSILIPCYNAEQWIEQTLQSAFQQTYTPIEIIVVDDGSSDRSASIIEKHQNVSLIRQSNRGAAAARNIAFAHSHGDYIQYLDADDLLHPEKIAQQVAILQTAPEAICTCRWGRFTSDSTLAQFAPDELWQNLSPVEWLVTSWNKSRMMHPGAWLVPRQIIERAGSWDESSKRTLNDDGEFFTRVVLRSTEVRYCDQVSSHYRSGLPNSLSGDHSLESLEYLVRTAHKMADALLAHEDSARTRQAAANLLQLIVYTVYPQLPDEIRQVEQRIAVLGGSSIDFPSGPTTAVLANIIGWKLARKIRNLFG